MQQHVTFKTSGKQLINITADVAEQVAASDCQQGICQLFLQHTSASLILSENSDPQVCRDLEHFISRLVPDGDPIFGHTAEGLDDMSAHVRSVLTQNSLTIPIADGRLALGIWQGIFLWEHRLGQFNRRLLVTIL